MEGLNFDTLGKKRAFLNGTDSSIVPVMPAATTGKKKKPTYASFHPLGDVLPI